jgi:hypothetical protein
MSPRQRAAVVALYATAMGYLEAAVVFYLRTMVNRIVPHQPNPLPDIPPLAVPELLRELATLIMLAAVGWLAGKTWRARIGFALFAFGIWDITYYLFLIPLTGWPKSLFDWDILFLIPLPWWGPVIAPVSIATLMIAFGILATILELGEPPIWPRKIATMVCAIGISVALYIFMSDAISVASQGEAAIRSVLPQAFQWPWFLCAWVLMGVPIADMTWQLATRYR